MESEKVQEKPESNSDPHMEPYFKPADEAGLLECEFKRLSIRNNHTGHDKKSLVGLALSGGGIRSAIFSLGVMQALAKNGLLEKFDYLSTVSGGGYIGSSLTWLLSKQAQRKSKPSFGLNSKNFPYGTDDSTSQGDSPDQRRMLAFLRHHGKYLTPGAGISTMSLVAITLRGILLNLIVWIPVSVAIMTGLLFASATWFSPDIVWGRRPGLFDFILYSSYAFGGIFLAFIIYYSLHTFMKRSSSEDHEGWDRARRYGSRRFFENKIRWVIWCFLVLLIVGTLPIISGLLGEKIVEVGGPGALLAGVASAFWAFAKSGSGKKGRIPLGLIVSAGAVLVIYGLALMSYRVAFLYFDGMFLNSVYAIRPVVFLLGKGFAKSLGGVILYGPWFIALVTAVCVNLNYISIHRYYRDRLMETFMPNIENALDDDTGPAETAEPAKISKLSGGLESEGPYHIVNTNVVLVDSENRKYRTRGGDSFILSPFYCGSRATGWRKTDKFMGDGMTLATAMAISGAAAHPNAGVGGSGVTRNPLVSLLMALLNLRLGYWIPHPAPKIHPKTCPNHIHSAWYELTPNGYREDRKFLQLSDGGHFENLAVYELIRRKVQLIVVCDGGADKDFTFSDLQTTLRRAKSDFGARITFDDNNQPTKLIPKKEAGYPPGVKLAEQGHIIGDIDYGNGGKGTLIFLKTTMIPDLSMEQLGYKGANPDFPDQSTIDQFFDEEQFEAYRELGYCIASGMIRDIKTGVSGIYQNKPGLAGFI